MISFGHFQSGSIGNEMITRVPLAQLAFDADIATVGLHDSFAQAKPKAESTGGPRS